MNALQEAYNSTCRHNGSIAKSVISWFVISLFLASCGGGDSNSSGGATPLKDFSATAGSYGEAIFIGEDTPSPLTGLNPADANAFYASADEDICTVNSETGTVTGVKEGECRITLTLSKIGYNDKTIEYILPVTFLPLNIFKGRHLFKGIFLGFNTNPTFSDIDRDGDNDLVIGTIDGTLKYYRRNADDALTLFTEQTNEDNPFNGFDVGR